MAITSSFGIVGGNGCVGSSGSWLQIKNGKKKNLGKNRAKFVCVSSSSVMDSYKTLRIRPDASESEVKKAFRQLAKQYHPDVCRGNNCGIQFSQINEAYDLVMRSFRQERYDDQEMYGSSSYEECDEEMRGMGDQDWDLWEEWMGWEGAGIRDYSSHVNPYI